MHIFRGQMKLYTSGSYIVTGEPRDFVFGTLTYHSKSHPACGDAFPIEGVLVATYLLSVEALPHCRCGVANKSCMV